MATTLHRAPASPISPPTSAGTDVSGIDHRRRPAAVGRRQAAVLAEGLIATHLLAVAATSDLPWVGRATMGVTTTAMVAAVMALTARRRPVHRGIGMVIGGLIGTVAGAGAGVMHLIVLGPSPMGLLGTAALAAGLVLLVIGTVVATRALPGRWRLLALPLGIVVLQLVAPTLPFALYVTHVPIEPFDATAPDGAAAVVVPADDGTDLAAWYIPSTNGAAVLLRHGSGAGSSKASTAAHAAVLASHGYGVLAMDARGHGQSQGQAMDWGWYGDSDVAAGVAWLTGRPEVDLDRIGGVGLSMGGEELIGALASEPRLRAVVAEGVTARTGADHTAFGYTGLPAMVDPITSAIRFGTADLLTRASRPTPLADAVGTRNDQTLLLITGSSAHEQRTAAHLQATAPAAVEVWDVPDAAHTAALRTYPAEWERRVITVLDAALS